MNVKEWYTSTYPTDELGERLNENVSFNDLFKWMDRRKDVYVLLSVCDSLVRERIFEKLSNIMQVPYNEVYEQWLLCD